MKPPLPGASQRGSFGLVWWFLVATLLHITPRRCGRWLRVDEARRFTESKNKAAVTTLV